MTSDKGMPRISRNRANSVGRILSAGVQHSDDADYVQAMMIAQRWRAQHVEPTEQCFSKVLECSQGIPQSVATFRMKRMISIVRKLQRPNTHFRLGELDDIGGCRLIVESNEQVERAAAWLASNLPLKNGSADKNYIARPQASGYRSRHLLCNVESHSSSYHVERRIEIPGVDDFMNEDNEIDYDNAVLVYARNAEQLAVAYPNYSTNVRYFLDKVESYLH